MESIKDFLRSIGIGKNESEIYIILIAEGPLTAFEIAKKSGVHRSNVYDAVENLVSHGFAWETIHDGKKIFCARPPTSLLDYIRHKETELREIIKKIIFNPSKKEESGAYLSKGKFALKEAVMGLLAPKKPIFVFGIPHHANEIIGPILQEFHKERVRQRIFMKHIYNSEGAERARYLNSMLYTEARCLPSKYDSATTTNIVGDRVVLINWTPEISVIEIHDVGVANSYRNYFEMLWKQSRVV
jgi:sugar-specific transcriptional regulator TrmB